MKKILLLMVFLIFLINEGSPQCTSFCLISGDTILLGNTLDWYFGDGFIVINKRNVSKTPLGNPTQGRWISKYGSITINQWGREFPYRGMNEAGLAIVGMALADTRYPQPDSRPAFSHEQWLQYELDNCATIEEVIASDSKVRFDISADKGHYLMVDSTGSCAVIEWLNGSLVCHKGESLPLKALTNSTYASLIEFYAQKTPHPVDDYCTWARFYRVAEKLENYNSFSDGPVLEYAWSILESVNSPDRTKWRLLFDVANRRFYFKTNTNNSVRYVDFKSFDFSCDTPVKMLDANANLSGNVQQYFIDYSAEANRALIRKMADLIGPITGTVPESYVQSSMLYPETTSCNTAGIDSKELEKNYFNLFQNSPNPFNPSTAIRYQLPAFSNIKLAVYNLFGQKVKTLVDSFQIAGEHSIVWNGIDDSNNPVCSGIYFYRLEADKMSYQQRMILVR